MQQNVENERSDTMMASGEENIQSELVVKDERNKTQWLKLLDSRMVILFVFGALIGITLKTHALKTITMGYDDYRLKNTKHDFVLTENRAVENEQAMETAEPEQEGAEVIEELE